MTITAHCLVKNEARFVWFAVMSVIDYVDKVLLWDTGSSDQTPEIIKTIKRAGPTKIDFKEVGEVDPAGFMKIRQEMLEATNTDWFIVVDGDEIWWNDSIKKVVDAINNKDSTIESVVVPTINLLGDIYHYQEEKAGRYHLAGRNGHLNLRGVNRHIPGLKSDKPHGSWGWVDEEDKMIQYRDPQKVFFVDAPYLHATHLPRSLARTGDILVPKRAHKLKYEIGIEFPRDFYYPEVLFKARPAIVSSPWPKMDLSYKAKALWQTPLKKIKRRLI
ncbi:glycosyltransferase [Candidatus Microgenomates bacterium]|nr:glycosyltransferase [Candidatus Microgenomates bacterium]